MNGDGNCLFIALLKSTFGDDSMHLTVRQNIYDYIIQNRARFKDFMEDDVDVTEYIAKILLDGEWGEAMQSLLLFLSFITYILIFDSIGSEQSITTVTTLNYARTISILFSHDHYDSLVSKSEENEVIKIMRYYFQK